MWNERELSITHLVESEANLTGSVAVFVTRTLLASVMISASPIPDAAIESAPSTVVSPERENPTAPPMTAVSKKGAIVGLDADFARVLAAAFGV